MVAFLAAQLELERQARVINRQDENGQLPFHRALRASEPSLGSIKLMAAANPASLTTADNQGFIPLHFACQLGHLDIVKYLVDANEESLRVESSSGHLPLHLACLGGHCSIVNYILERSFNGVSLRIHDKLPIELLLCDYANCDTDSLEFVEAFGRLLRANPEVVKNALGVTHDDCAHPIPWNSSDILMIFLAVLMNYYIWTHYVHI
jgi:ankyrin repeat protein